MIERDNIVVDGAGHTLQGTGDYVGIIVSGRSNITIKNLKIRAFYYGIHLSGSSNNSISGNSITNNNYDGIHLWRSSNNKFCHNNFVNNTQQAYSYESTNVWDDGYPSGGNYWSDHLGVDTDYDGIGDTQYEIDANNVDGYPLMAPFNTFDAGTWNGTAYNVDIVSNSTISHFHFNPDDGPFLRFNVTGEDGTAGFCKVTIPVDLL